MATTIRIKRSVGNTAPTGLAQGELAYVEASGTGDGRLYIGAAGSTVEVVGGQYFVDVINALVSANIDTLSVPANTTISAFGKTLIENADASATLDDLGITAFIKTLLDDADAAAARSTLGVDAAGTDNSTDVTLAGTYDYLSISGQEITMGQIDLATDVTGDLPFANIQNIATASFVGRQTVGTGDMEVLSAAEATALLNLFNSSVKGLVPASGGGTSNFLRADGTWATPPGATGGVSYQGGYNASTNSPDLDTSPSGVLKGHMYKVTVAGTFFTEELEVGDSIIADQDNPTLLSHWTLIQDNVIPASTSNSGTVELATAAETTAGTDATRAITPDALANCTIDGGTFS